MNFDDALRPTMSFLELLPAKVGLQSTSKNTINQKAQF